MTEDIFFNACKAAFAFLVDEYGFDPDPDRRNESYGQALLYKNRTTAVELYWEFREMHIYVHLYRLLDDQVPPYPIFIGPDTKLDMFLLDWVLQVRAPELLPLPRIYGGARYKESIEQVIEFLANALRTYAADILSGDFSIFPQLDKIVKSQLKGA